LAAWLLGVGALAVAGTVVLHLLARNLPKPWTLPTARFVPQAAVSALTRARTPRDVAVLIARAIALGAIALAAAGPLLRSARPSVERIFVADLSRSVAERRAVVDAIAAQATDGDRIVALTDRPVMVSRDSLLALSQGRPPRARGRLSSALLRAAALADRTPTATLVVVSPLARDVIDAAWPAVQRTWSGAITVVRAGRIVPGDSAASAGWNEFRGVITDDDPLAASLAALGMRRTAGADVVLDRSTPAPPPPAARAGASVHVIWPRSDAAPVERDSSSAFGGLTLGDTVLLAPLSAVTAAPIADSGAAVDTVVRWLDGTPAAIEAATEDHCVRSVAIGVPAAGDLVVRARWLAMVRTLLGPCGGVRDTVPVVDSAVARPAPARGAQQASVWQDGRSPDPWVVRALLLVAALALAAEWWLRRRGATS
jgi:hypothetical protein